MEKAESVTIEPTSQLVGEIESKIVARLRRHQNNPVFIALGRQLEELKDRHQRGLLRA